MKLVTRCEGKIGHPNGKGINGYNTNPFFSEYLLARATARQRPMHTNDVIQESYKGKRGKTPCNAARLLAQSDRDAAERKESRSTPVCATPLLVDYVDFIISSSSALHRPPTARLLMPPALRALRSCTGCEGPRSPCLMVSRPAPIWPTWAASSGAVGRRDDDAASRPICGSGICTSSCSQLVSTLQAASGSRNIHSCIPFSSTESAAHLLWRRDSCSTPPSSPQVFSTSPSLLQSLRLPITSLSQLLMQHPGWLEKSRGKTRHTAHR